MSKAFINGRCVSNDSGWYKGRSLDPDSEEFKELVKDGVHVIYDKDDNVLMLVPDSDVMHEIMIHDIELKVKERIWRENRVKQYEARGGNGMAKYRKKPVVVEAIQWDGRGVSKAIEFCGIENLDIVGKYPGKLKIKTLEGVMAADIGDYIIKGIKGECYPCKPDIFHMTYEPVED